MAKVRVRALVRGYDGESRREPGDEFDFDPEVNGKGKWYELVNEAEKLSPPPKRSKKTSKRDDVDDLLA